LLTNQILVAAIVRYGGVATALYWEYDEDDTEVSSLILGFREDGYIAMEKRELKTGLVEERKTIDTLERNRVAFPEFGHYDHLCKEER
jgi:hypothetical protein